MRLTRSYLSVAFARLAQYSAGVSRFAKFLALWFGAKSYDVLNEDVRELHWSGKYARQKLDAQRHARQRQAYEKAHAWEHAVQSY